MEHRWGDRAKVDVPVRVHAAGWRAPRSACLRNVSASGALLEMEHSPPPLKRIEIEIGVRKDGQINLMTIGACVLRRAESGVGVEWCEALPCGIEELVSGTAVMAPHDR